MAPKQILFYIGSALIDFSYPSFFPMTPQENDELRFHCIRFDCTVHYSLNSNFARSVDRKTRTSCVAPSFSMGFLLLAFMKAQVHSQRVNILDEQTMDHCISCRCYKGYITMHLARGGMYAELQLAHSLKHLTCFHVCVK